MLRGLFLTLSTTPPYKPGYGLLPPLLVGRDDLLAWTWAAMVAGPGHPDFHQAWIGERGTGKTVLAELLATRVRAELGWAVLTHHAVAGEELLTALMHKLPEALGVWGRRGRELRQLEKELNVGFNLGVLSANTTVRSNSASPPVTIAFERLVQDVGGYAKRHSTGLLLVVDEAHVVQQQPDLGALSRSMQTAVRLKVPVAVLLVGLPELRGRFTGAGTFISRLQTRELGDLAPDAARLALVEPAARLGVSYAPEALDLLVARANGRPYHVQLFGYHCWRAAEAGHGFEHRQATPQITAHHAQSGLVQAYIQLDSEFAPTWQALRPTERDYLRALIAIGPYQASTDSVAAHLGHTQKHVSVPRDRLVNDHAILEAPERGVVRFRTKQFADWIMERRPAGQPSVQELLKTSFPMPGPESDHPAQTALASCYPPGRAPAPEFGT